MLIPLLLSCALAPTLQEDAASVESYESLNADFRVAMEAWGETANAMVAEHEGDDFDYSSLPEMPYAAFYPRYRAHADRGLLEARMWCLDSISYSSLTEPIQHQFFRSEAISLAMCVRQDADHARKFSANLSGLATMGFAREADEALAFLAAVTEVDSITRAAIMCRRMSLGVLANEGDKEAATTSKALTEELIRRWPDSDEAQHLAGLQFRDRALVKGKIAPPLTGVDVDGNALSLDDYRGKVVVVDFWGFW